MIQVTPFDSLAALNAACIDAIRSVLQADAATRQAVMLSGGRTPLAIFREIAENPFPVSPQACITFTDERHVPIDSPDSNHGATLPMLRALHIPDERVLHVHTELSLEDAAERFHEDFDAFLLRGGQIPLAFLGLGTDGHTCSLFSQEDIDRGIDRYASPTWRPTQPHRVTVTPTLLERCERIVFLVTGEDKADVIAQLLETPDAIPAGRATARCKNVHLWRA